MLLNGLVVVFLAVKRFFGIMVDLMQIYSIEYYECPTKYLRMRLLNSYYGISSDNGQIKALGARGSSNRLSLIHI